MQRTMLVLLVVLLVASVSAITLITAAEEARAAGVTRLPHALRLQPGQRFFLYGEPMLDSLVFDHRDGVLWVNERQLLPPPPPPPGYSQGSMSDSLLLALYGEVPFVRDCLARAVSCPECVRRFDARRDSMTSRIASRWRELRRPARAGVDPSNGQIEAWADSALQLLDSTIVGPLEEARKVAYVTKDGLLRFVVPGAFAGDTRVFISAADIAMPASSDSIEAAEALARVRRYASILRSRKPALVIVSRGGDVGVVGRRVGEFLDEITAVRSNPDYKPKHLSGGQSNEFRQFVSR